MRQLLSDISEKLEIKLLHCDMFPYKHSNIIDMGLGESNVINVAYGISMFEPVFVYGVCGFLLHRLEQLKLNLRFAEHPVILFNAGGSNHPCYREFGEGHTCDEDIEIAKILKVPVYTPSYEDFNATVSELLLTEGLKIVRLT
jgi:transketolase C-terminal domain/subunit